MELKDRDETTRKEDNLSDSLSIFHNVSVISSPYLSTEAT
jgi:hypothetical protein